MIFRLAIKNIFRNRRRTILTLTAITFAVFLAIVADGFNKGFEWRTGNLFMKTETGIAKIVSHDYELEDIDNPLDYSIKNYYPIINRLKLEPRVKEFSPRVTFSGRLNNGVEDIKATGIGIDPLQENAVFNRSKGIIAGSFLKPNESGIIVGAKLAELLELTVGSYVTVVARATEMGYNATDLEVKGLIQTGNMGIDENTFFVPIAFAQDFLSFPMITDIAIQLKHNNQLTSFLKDFAPKQKNADYKVFSWRDFARDYISIIEIQNKKIAVLTITILLMAGAGILNTMLMAMMERKREIGNLMAIGVDKSKILLLLLVEGLLIGFIGSVVGLLAGSSVILFFQENGINLADKIRIIPVVDKFYTHLDLKVFFQYLVIGTLVAGLASIYPAVKAIRLLPVEALRNSRG
jgi:putative ABC transport system permease protein